MATKELIKRIIGVVMICLFVSYVIIKYYNIEFKLNKEESETIDYGNAIVSFYEVYGLTEEIPFEVTESIPKIDGFIPIGSLNYLSYPQNIVGVTDNEQNKKVIIDELAKLNSLPKNSFFCWTKWKQEYIPSKKQYYFLYLLKKYQKELIINNEEISEAEVRFSEFSNMPEIILKFNESGKNKWKKITKKAANNNKDCIAIVIDFEVYFCPSVSTPMNRGVVSMLIEDKNEAEKIVAKINEMKN